MKHVALVSSLLIAFASLGCGGTSDDETDAGVDSGTGGADGGTGGTDGGTGGTDGGTGGTDGGTGGTDGGTGGTVGGDQCDRVGAMTGAGWTGAPSCSATQVAAGDPLTCTVQSVGAIEVGVSLVDRDNFLTAGGGFISVSADGAVEIPVDTQFAEPGVYTVVFDATEGSDFIVFTFGESSSNENYWSFEVSGGMMASDLEELPGCFLLTLTIVS
jgi:hypothetical protein